MEAAMPLALLFALFVVAGASADAVRAADYAREERWAQEVVPSLVVGDAVYLATPARPRILAILTEPSGAAGGGIVIVHGLGVHPDWGLIGGLRTGLADTGYVTLSVQMPVLSADATRDDYRDTLPEAGDRIAAAIAHLRAKGVTNIAIVSHSMGASMANAYLARPGALPILAWAPVGMFGAFAVPPKEPVLDLIAEREIELVAESAPARAQTLPTDACSRQVTIPGTDHYFDNRQKELVRAIAAFLDRAFAGGCPRSARGKDQSRSSSSPRVARVRRSSTASHASSWGTASMRIAPTLAASSARRFA
jgi:alpha/beta superfamily hydrolase